MQIDIVFDVTCPWSFIGKRQLERALQRRPRLAADVTWRPFQINPDLPQEGIDRELYLARKFGSLADGQRVYETIARAGNAVGIAFAFDRIGRTPNTRDAHCLVGYAAARGKATAAVECLFCSYFISGRDIGDPVTLVQIARELGLDAADAAGFLESPTGVDRVLPMDRDATQSGIGAIPAFIFNRRYAISGAHEPEIFMQIIDEADGTRRPSDDGTASTKREEGGVSFDADLCREPWS
jgi:predicted DsbA family dithiol-disulfide isomerase